MKIAIYPGSFDPVTNGHLDIIKRASSLFDKLIIAVVKNYNKKTLFTISERVELLKKVTEGIKNIDINWCEGLLVDYALKVNATYIVRGLRALSDFEYEFEIALTNRMISDRKIDTVFFMTDEKYFFTSSSLAKEVVMLGGDFKEKVPEVVIESIKKKLRIKNIKNKK